MYTHTCTELPKSQPVPKAYFQSYESHVLHKSNMHWEKIDFLF